MAWLHLIIKLLVLVAASTDGVRAFLSQSSASAFLAQRPLASIAVPKLVSPIPASPHTRSIQLHVALSTPFLSWRNDTFISPTERLFPVNNPSTTPNKIQQERMHRRRQKPSTSHSQSRQLSYHVFCDLDGVLVDFEHGIRKIFPSVHHGIQINDIHRPTMWQKVASTGSFFESLPWTSGGKRLWNAIRPLQPDILTGVPTSYHQARAQKVRWCQRELGLRTIAHVDMAGHLLRHTSMNGVKRVGKDARLHDVVPTNDATEDEEAIANVITCWSHNKHQESGPGRVLIDDCKKLEDAWVAKGGIFIHHQGDAEESIGKLYELGILVD